MVGQFFIQYIFVALFNTKERGTLTEKEFLEYIKTEEYITKLNSYINSKVLLIIFITMIIFIPVFYKVYKKYKKENNFKIKNIFIPVVLGITISLIYNISVYNLNNVIHFTNMFELSKLPIMVQIISSGICGPILEEFIFRGIVYNKLKTFNKKMTAIILTSIIFGIVHSNIINGIYAFGVSFILIYLYEKYKTLKVPIIMHIFLNTTIILMLPLIIKNYIAFNLYLLVMSIIILIIINKYIKKDV
jgi:membrane protease YdiL (CAAX protease family)